MYIRLRHLAVSLIFLLSSSAIGQIYVIGNPIIGIPKLSIPQCKKIYLRQTHVLDSGIIAYPLDQDKNSAIRKEFYRKVIQMSAGALKAYWSKRLFMEMSGPPPILPDDAAVIDKVMRNKGAIGYVSRRPKNRAIPILTIIP